MPGLSQLKQFNADLLNLGDEVKIRSARGEKAVTIPIPKKIPDIDDSEDFVHGMPQISEEEQEQAEAAAAEMEREANDFSDITGEGKEVTPSVSSNTAQKAPDVSDLLAPSANIGLDDLDLSDFEDPEEEEAEDEVVEETPIEDMDLDALLASGDESIQEEEAVPQEDAPRYVRPERPKKEPDLNATRNLDMDNFLNGLDLDDEPAADESASGAGSSDDNKDFAQTATSAAADTSSGSADDLLDPLPASFDMDAANEDFSDSGALDMNEGIPDEFNEQPGDGTLGSADKTAPVQEASETVEEVPSSFEDFSVDDLFADEPATSEGASADDFNLDEMNFDNADEPAQKNGPDVAESDMPLDEESAFEDTAAEQNDDLFGEFGGAGSDEEGAADENVTDESPAAAQDDFSLDLPNFDEENTVVEPSETAVENPAEEFNADSLDGLPNFEDDGSAMEENSIADGESVGEAAQEDSAAATDDFTLPDMDLPPEGNAAGETVAEEGAAEEDDEPVETFDTSGMEGMDDADFGSGGNSDFEMDNITDMEGGDDMFSIPGFSDTDEAVITKKKAPVVETPDFSGAKEDEASKPKNSFTDAEYRLFQKNLAEYPLNVRIALEDVVVKNELTDDALFSVLEMVLRKVPARQLASQLEKMLDIQLSVPRDFELRTAAEYEAYKQSIEYKLKNQIIPGAILSAIAAILIFCIFIVVRTFVFYPLMADKYYKQGYSLIQEEQYPQSLEKFNKAITFKPVKKWFFAYAQSYREHKQFGRAELPSDKKTDKPSLGPDASTMYRAILERFNHDKQAGIEWADMEMENFNWTKAERILKREVLDYYINDPDALLALGDLYLEWADADVEGDPEKFPEAKKQYDLLVELYGKKPKNFDKYSARQMRYYIRTDDLAQVLNYKNYFYPKKMKNIEPSDVTELGGYLFEKRYGTLRPSEENMRSSIENVKSILSTAVERDVGEPVPLYNMMRYYVQTGNSASAKSMCQAAIDSFEDKKILKRKDKYKYINTYRILGEVYRDEMQYIQAEQAYIKGIELFEKNRDDNKFATTENIGKLYADLGDIYYFKDGNMNAALENYMDSINNKNDTPSVRYRVGYIQYNNSKFAEALNSFRLGSEADPMDTHMLLALANTLSCRNDYHAASGYYEKLLSILDSKIQNYKIMLPQVRKDHGDIVDTYMKASNNLGVALSRIANISGSSEMNGKAIVALQDSLRAWDALSRNQETMVRLDSSNLAEQNIKYITIPNSEYEPEIYTKIPMLMDEEEGLE